MKTRTFICLLLGTLLLASACAPAASNCNHPDHEKYIRSKTQKKMKKSKV